MYLKIVHEWHVYSLEILFSVYLFVFNFPRRKKIVYCILQVSPFIFISSCSTCKHVCLLRPAKTDTMCVSRKDENLETFINICQMQIDSISIRYFFYLLIVSMPIVAAKIISHPPHRVADFPFFWLDMLLIFVIVITVWRSRKETKYHREIQWEKVIGIWFDGTNILMTHQHAAKK